MLEFFRRNRVLLTSLACLGMAAVLVASTATGRGRTDRLGGVLLDVMAPFQRGGALVERALSELWQDAVGIFRRRATFDRLQARVDELEEQVVHLDELKHENETLRDLLAFRDRLAGQTIAAAVIGRDATGLARTVTIDHGQSDGVLKGAAVLAPGGVVGQVFLSGAHAARVLLMTDHNSGIDAVVQRTRAHGIVEGTVSEACGLKFVKRTEDLQPGDAIVTSGVDGIFPRGLPLGQIVSVDKRGQGLFQYASVRPFVDFDRLENVFVTRGPVEAMQGGAPMSAPME
jgi:rod shape-determining protein MreC